MKQAAATVTITETQEGEYATPTSPGIDDDFTDGDESNPATMGFSISPSPILGTWSVDGNTFAWDQSTDVGGLQEVDTVTLTDSPTEGQFFLEEDVAGEFGSFIYNADASTVESAIDAEIAYGVSGGSGGPWT